MCNIAVKKIIPSSEKLPAFTLASSKTEWRFYYDDGINSNPMSDAWLSAGMVGMRRGRVAGINRTKNKVI